MGYRLTCSDSRVLSLTDREWHSLLFKAGSSGWKPEGTYYDMGLQLDLLSSEDDIFQNTFVYITVNSRFLHWDGNYTDKENQIVSEEDALYMMRCLDDGDTPSHIVEFLKSGSFRISEGELE